MKSSVISTILFAALGVHAAPTAISRRDNAADASIIQFALALEHIEVAFYTGALQQFNESTFEGAGFPSWVRKRFVEIKEHEKTHVRFLSSALETLGAVVPASCNYSFPYTDVSSFAALSSVIEGVGTSAYLGAAPFLTEEAHVTAAGSILATEARQQAWLASAVEHGAPWSTSFQTPLDMRQAFSLAAPFIIPGSCPSSNPTLPNVFPALTVTNTESPSDAPTPGGTATFGFDTQNTTGPYFAAFLSGLKTFFAPIENGTVTIPEKLIGTVYVVVSTNGTAVTDDNTVAGPQVLMFPF